MNSTLSQIEKNPELCWRRMTPLELQRFEEKYYARIEREAQQKVTLAMINEHKLAAIAEKKRKYETKVLMIAQRITHLHEHSLTDEMIRYHGRSVGNDIHDLSRIWTGYESEESIAQKMVLGYKHCDEHFWPRQYAGEYIVKCVCLNAGISFEYLVTLLNKFRQVHRVTPEENRRLMKYQHTSVFTTPEDAYEQAGVILIKQKDTKDER